MIMMYINNIVVMIHRDSWNGPVPVCQYRHILQLKGIRFIVLEWRRNWINLGV